jgi:C1A family cysteine protease
MTAAAPRQIARYGWRPDLPDARDLAFAPRSADSVHKLPLIVDLREHVGDVLDQGQLGSCTANALAKAQEFAMRKAGRSDVFTPSRLFIYYGEREIEQSVGYDSGAFIRDGAKVLHKDGAPPEIMWPYNIGRFTEKPPAEVYDQAMKFQTLRYRRVARSIEQMKACLFEGNPFVVGFTVYDSFESDETAQTGMMPMPAAGESVLGGHAVLVVGYDDRRGAWIVLNSWGPGWGDHGYFYMPQPYLMRRDLSSDFWTIELLEAA